MNEARRFGYQGIIVLVAVGFLFTAIEVRYLHINPVKETWIAWIPTIAAALGVLGAALGLGASAGIRKFAAGILAVVAVAGVAGVYFHTELKPERFARLFESGRAEPAKSENSDKDKAAPPAAVGDQKPESRRSDEGGGEKKGDDDGSAPPLAPLAMCGLGLIGALAILAKQD